MKILSSKDIPDHAHEQITHIAEELLVQLFDLPDGIAFAALQCAMIGYLIQFPYETQKQIIDSIFQSFMENAERMKNDKID